MAKERDGKTMATSILDSIKTTRGVKENSTCSRTTALTLFIKSNMSMEKWLKRKNYKIESSLIRSEYQKEIKCNFK